MPLRARDAGVEDAPLQGVNHRAVLAVHAEGGAQGPQGPEHLEGLRVIEPQMVVGKVGLEAADALLSHAGEVGAVALVPFGERHVKGIVGRAGAVGTTVPLGKGVGHGHAAVGRCVVHDRGGAAAGRRARARLEAVGRPVHAGPALHVRVGVDETGKHPAARNVIDLVALGGLEVHCDAHHLVSLERHVAVAKTLGAHERAVLDDDHSNHLLSARPAGRAGPPRAQLSSQGRRRSRQPEDSKQ